MPSYADFDEREYRERLRKVHRAMKDNGLDGLLLTQAENVYYLSGTISALPWGTKDRPFILVVPEDGEPGFITTASMKKAIGEVSWAGRYYGVERPEELVTVLKESIRDSGLSGKHIGVETGRSFRLSMPIEDFDELRASSIGHFVNADSAIWYIRQVKTEEEIRRIKDAVAISCRAMENAFRLFKRGMTEREFSRVVSRCMLDEGADKPSWVIMVSGERYLQGIQGTYPLDQPIREGSYLDIDWGASKRYYTADLDRVAHLGDLSRDARDFYDMYVGMTKAGIEAVKPGVKARDIHNAMLRIVEESGFKVSVISERFGHGLGLDPHEPPNLGKADTTVLETGMVLAIEPWGILNEVGLKFGCEENIVVTEAGCEALSANLSQELRIL